MAKKRNWIPGGLAALAAAGAMMRLPASAQTSINLQIGTPPPPVRYAVMPQPRRGYVWVPGHWEWRGNRHVWKAGYYLAARPGYYYQQPTWVQEGNRWAYRGGGWNRGHRDRDHDGIRDRRDNDRDNDGIRNNRDRDRDRDGDGVRNRNDRAPNNPNRN